MRAQTSHGSRQSPLTAAGNGMVCGGMMGGSGGMGTHMNSLKLSFSVGGSRPITSASSRSAANQGYSNGPLSGPGTGYYGTGCSIGYTNGKNGPTNCYSPVVRMGSLGLPTEDSNTHQTSQLSNMGRQSSTMHGKSRMHGNSTIHGKSSSNLGDSSFMQSMMSSLRKSQSEYFHGDATDYIAKKVAGLKEACRLYALLALEARKKGKTLEALRYLAVVIEEVEDFILEKPFHPSVFQMDVTLRINNAAVLSELHCHEEAREDLLKALDSADKILEFCSQETPTESNCGIYNEAVVSKCLLLENLAIESEHLYMRKAIFDGPGGYPPLLDRYGNIDLEEIEKPKDTTSSNENKITFMFGEKVDIKGGDVPSSKSPTGTRSPGGNSGLGKSGGGGLGASTGKSPIQLNTIYSGYEGDMDDLRSLDSTRSGQEFMDASFDSVIPKKPERVANVGLIFRQQALDLAALALPEDHPIIEYLAENVILNGGIDYILSVISADKETDEASERISVAVIPPQKSEGNAQYVAGGGATPELHIKDLLPSGRDEPTIDSRRPISDREAVGENVLSATEGGKTEGGMTGLSPIAPKIGVINTEKRKSNVGIMNKANQRNLLPILKQELGNFAIKQGSKDPSAYLDLSHLPGGRGPTKIPSKDVLSYLANQATGMANPTVVEDANNESGGGGPKKNGKKNTIAMNNIEVIDRIFEDLMSSTPQERPAICEGYDMRKVREMNENYLEYSQGTFKMTAQESVRKSRSGDGTSKKRPEMLPPTPSVAQPLKRGRLEQEVLLSPPPVEDDLSTGTTTNAMRDSFHSGGSKQRRTGQAADEKQLAVHMTKKTDAEGKINQFAKAEGRLDKDLSKDLSGLGGGVRRQKGGPTPTMLDVNNRDPYYTRDAFADFFNYKDSLRPRYISPTHRKEQVQKIRSLHRKHKMSVDRMTQDELFGLRHYYSTSGHLTQKKIQWETLRRRLKREHRDDIMDKIMRRNQAMAEKNMSKRYVGNGNNINRQVDKRDSVISQLAAWNARKGENLISTVFFRAEDIENDLREKTAELRQNHRNLCKMDQKLKKILKKPSDSKHGRKMNNTKNKKEALEVRARHMDPELKNLWREFVNKRKKDLNISGNQLMVIDGVDYSNADSTTLHAYHQSVVLAQMEAYKNSVTNDSFINAEATKHRQHNYISVQKLKTGKSTTSINGEQSDHLVGGHTTSSMVDRLGEQLGDKLSMGIEMMGNSIALDLSQSSGMGLSHALNALNFQSEAEDHNGSPHRGSQYGSQNTLMLGGQVPGEKSLNEKPLKEYSKSEVSSIVLQGAYGTSEMEENMEAQMSTHNCTQSRSSPNVLDVRSQSGEDIGRQSSKNSSNVSSTSGDDSTPRSRKSNMRGSLASRSFR